VADDEAALRAKLAALDAEVRADADAARLRKEAALAKARAAAAERAAEQRALEPAKPAAKPKAEAPATSKALVKAKPRALPARVAHEDPEPDDDSLGLGGALELASRANRVKQELTKKQGKGDKSWVKSGVASLVLGPLGWLYAGSLREAVPASAAWVLLATLASKILPVVLLMPVLFVALPLSAIAGVVYALQYNRHGGRQRLFGDDKKQLPGG
jgi:hypothetical protein